MRTWLPAAACALFALPALSPAAPPPPALDPEPTAPYTWRVVVRFDPHPRLDTNFRHDILSNIRAALQPPEGDLLWRLEVTDLATVPEEKRDPLWKAFAAKGWPALESTEFRPLTGVKTHFLRVSYAGNAYKLEARQHDGYTGLASPVVRTAETRDAQTVGRLAGMMVAKDFGPVGVVEKVPNQPDFVTVKFRGGALPGFDRFVKPGDVFAVATITEQPRPRKAEPAKGPGGFRKPADDAPPVRTGQPRAFILLRAESSLLDGACRCAVIEGSTAQKMTLSRGVVGYKCLKLGTTESPVRVKVQDANGGPPAGTELLQVRATDKDFPLRADPRDSLKYEKDGVFHSLRPLRNLACVVIAVGTTREAKFPLPVFGDAAQTVRLPLNEADAARAALELDCESLRAKAGEVRRDQTVLLGALGKMIQANDHTGALARVNAALQNQAAADAEITAELDRLKKTPGADDPTPAAYLAATADLLADIRGNRPRIDQAKVQLDEAVKKLGDPVRFEREFRARELNAKIRQLVEAGEVPDALAGFDELYEFLKQDVIKERRDRLAKEWEPKGADHAKARDYVMNTWRAATTLAEFKAAREPLADAAATLTKNDDRLGLRNLVSSFETAYAKLKTITEGLDPNAELDKPALKDVQAIAQALSKLETDARAAVRKLEGPAGAVDKESEEKP